MTTLLNPYCTLQDVQSETCNESEEDYDLFKQEINAASRWIDDYCRRDFLYHDHSASPLVVKSAWCALNVIYLPTPIITLTKVVIGGVEFPADGYTFENSTPFASGKVTRGCRWIETTLPQLPPRIELYGTFGYVADPSGSTAIPAPALPQEIVTACRIMAAIRSGKVKREFTSPDGSRQSSTVSKLPSDILASLNRYRIGIV